MALRTELRKSHILRLGANNNNNNKWGYLNVIQNTDLTRCKASNQQIRLQEINNQASNLIFLFSSSSSSPSSPSSSPLILIICGFNVFSAYTLFLPLLFHCFLFPTSASSSTPILHIVTYPKGSRWSQVMILGNIFFLQF